MSSTKKLIQAPSYQEGCVISGIASIPTEYNKDTAVIFIAGFERFGYEQKWRLLSQEYNKKGLVTLQFDFTGLGISEGVYNQPTMENLLYDLQGIVTALKQELGILNLVIVGHSLGACVAVSAKYYNTIPGIKKLILIASALNQKELNRYRYTMNSNINKEIVITYDNYKDYFNESDYQLFTQSSQTKKVNIIDSNYMLEMSSIDFSNYVGANEEILVIHGDKDNTVPLSSISQQFSNVKVIVGGDHDMEKPGIVDKRIPLVIDFSL